MNTALLLVLALAACSSDPATPDPATQAAADPLAAPADVAAPPADAQKTASGLASKVLQAGTGTEHPGPKDKVTVHYTGWTTDGKRFDSSVERGEPTSFGLNQVIPGWTEGLQLMVIGEKRRLWIPEDIAYKGRAGKPAGMLVFDVELLGIEAAPKPITAPPDVAAPPADALKTATGLAYKELSPGTGPKPSADAAVRVHYTGWTTDGEMFDSSVMRGEPATFPLDGVIAGWTEGLQLMPVGSKFRLWIPQELAYEGKAGKPAGMLVFDVELLEIVPIPAAPKDLAAPKDAQKSPSGLAWRVLQEGSGEVPATGATVQIHFTGWTADGKMFDSSLLRGKPLTLPLARAFPGWQEGLSNMKVGEKRVFWVPELLAFQGRPGAPPGAIITEVELVGIKAGPPVPTQAPATSTP